MIIFLFTHQYFVEKQMIYLHIENRPSTIIFIKQYINSKYDAQLRF